MIIIENDFIPFDGFAAINICGILFVRQGTILSDRTKNHELIHTAQMKELAYVFFYIFYIAEWIVRLFMCKFNARKAYRNISFEREAYDNEIKLAYLRDRRAFSWISYILK